MYWRKKTVDNTERKITIFYPLYNDPNSEQIVNFFKRQITPFHFVINTVQMFGPAGNGRFETESF